MVIFLPLTYLVDVDTERKFPIPLPPPPLPPPNELEEKDVNPPPPICPMWPKELKPETHTFSDWVYDSASNLKDRNISNVWPESNEENVGAKDGKLPKPPNPPNPLEKNEPPVLLLLIPRCCCRRPPPKKSSPNGSSPTTAPQKNHSSGFHSATASLSFSHLEKWHWRLLPEFLHKHLLTTMDTITWTKLVNINIKLWCAVMLLSELTNQCNTKDVF